MFDILIPIFDFLFNGDYSYAVLILLSAILLVLILKRR